MLTAAENILNSVNPNYGVNGVAGSLLLLQTKHRLMLKESFHTKHCQKLPILTKVRWAIYHDPILWQAIINSIK